MNRRTPYALSLIAASLTLAACGRPSTGSASTPTIGPSSPDGLPPIQMTPFASPSVDAHNPTIAQCRKDVTAVTNATELYNRQHGIYAPDMKTLMSAGLLTSVPTDVHYGYDAPDIDPVVLGTVAGC